MVDYIISDCLILEPVFSAPASSFNQRFFMGDSRSVDLSLTGEASSKFSRDRRRRAAKSFGHASDRPSFPPHQLDDFSFFYGKMMILHTLLSYRSVALTC